MVSSTSVVLALAFAAPAHASVEGIIAGYAPGSNVEDHNLIDVSAKALANFLNGKDYAGTALTDTTVVNKKFELAKSMYTAGAGLSSTWAQYTVGEADGAMVADKTYTCEEDADGDGVTYELPLGKFAGKSLLASGASTQLLKVYMSNDVWEAKECGKVPFRAGATTLTGNDADYPSCASWSAGCADQYLDASCPGGGIGKDSTNFKIKCSASGVNDIIYDGSGATTYGSRTLKGFSTAVASKMVGAALPEPEAVAVESFHTVASYGDMTISAALEALVTGYSLFSSCSTGGKTTANMNLDETTCGAAGWTQGTAICKRKDTFAPMVNLGGTGVASTTGTYAADVNKCVAAGGKVTNFNIYSGASENALVIETIQKMAVYTNAWLYTIHEFEDAIADCNAATLYDNAEGVHAWDEGVAFYTGSEAGAAGANSGTNGVMIYALANKRCKNFKTCGAGEFAGNSAVNIALFDQFALGKNACQAGQCAKAQANLDKIIPLMSVPLIQGTLRYAYKVAVLSDNYKGFGEGYAFMMSVIHRVNACSASDAKIIYEALDIPFADPGVGGFKLGGAATAPGKGVAAYTAVKEAFERNYVCMGVTCADVGSLHDDNKVAMEGAVACIDSSTGGGGTGTTTEKDVLPTWAIIAIAGAGAMMVLFFGLMCAYKSSKDMTIKMYNDLKKEGAVGKV